MNRKRRVQSFSGFGLVRTKTYIATRVPKIPFEKIKTVYGNHLHGSRRKTSVHSFENIRFSPRLNELIYEEKKRQLYSYLAYGFLTLLAVILWVFIMNISYSI